MKQSKDKLATMGIRLDPASNVSNAIIEQVMAARSGKIFMPRSEEGRHGLSQWPLWASDAAFALQEKKVRRVL